MIQKNRDWKSFDDRWNRSSRFERFIFWSVLVHVALGLALWMPAHSAQEQQSQLESQLEEQRVREKEKEQRDKDEAKQEAEEQIYEMLKEEVAEEQLRDFFEELTEDFLDEELAEMYWDELLEMLNPELEELAGMFAFDDIGQIAIEMKVQEIKELIVEKLSEKLNRDRQDALAKEFLKQARELAQQMVASYQKQLSDRIGKPVGTKFKQTIEAEERSAYASLIRADAYTSSAIRTAQLAEQQMADAAKKLRQYQQDLDKANQGKEDRAVAQAKTLIGQQQKGLVQVGTRIGIARKSLQQGAEQLAPYYPALSSQLKSADDKSAKPGQENADAASKIAANVKPAEAAGKAESGRQMLQRARETAQQVQAAMKLQMALEQASQLARQASEQATTTEQIAGRRSEATRTKNQSQLALTDRESTTAGTRVTVIEQAAGRLGDQLASADKNLPGLKSLLQQAAANARESKLNGAKSASKESNSQDPGGPKSNATKQVTAVSNSKDAKNTKGTTGQKVAKTAGSKSATKQSSATKTGAVRSKSSGAKATAGTQPEGKPATASSDATEADSPVTVAALAAKATEAKAALSLAREALAQKAPADASKKLQNAAGQLGRLANDIRGIQRKIGRPDETVAESVLREIDGMRRGELAEGVRDQFNKLYREQAMPAILQQVGQATEKRAKAERVFSQAFQAELKKEMERVFGETLPKDVSAGEQVASTVGEQLSPQSQPQTTAEKAINAKTDDRGKSNQPAQPNIGESNQTGHGDPSADGNSIARVNSPRVAEAAQQAQAAASATAAKALPTIVASATRTAGLRTLGQAGAQADRRQSTFSERLQNLKNQLSIGRRDFLGQAKSTAVAATRRRYRGRRGSLLRLGSYGDVDAKAYREMAAAMKERGQVQGQEFALRTSDGDVSTADEQNTLQPALISIPEPMEKPTDDAAESDKPREVTQPTFKTHRFNGIPFVEKDAIKIDGDLSDWQGIQLFELDPVLKGNNKGVVQPAHQKAYLAYNSQGLLFAFDVIDTTTKLEDSQPMPVFWLMDCVEIFIDTLNTKYSVRGESNTHQFFAFPFGYKGDRETGGYEAQAITENGKAVWKRVPFPNTVFRRAGKKTEKGWTIELLIPKTLLRKGAVKPGRIIGLNLQLDTGSLLYYYWTCANKIISSQHPNTWGDIQFLGSDGRVELLDQDDESTESLFPGQPLRVRVVDPDMNLNELKKDKISVTVRTAAGDDETLILEETKHGSGIFLGSIGTRLNIGTSQTGWLEVFEGETITVDYIDQARAYGERNVPIKTSAAISSIGIKLVRRKVE